VCLHHVSAGWTTSGKVRSGAAKVWQGASPEHTASHRTPTLYGPASQSSISGAPGAACARHL
jgi:hypothetical protein